MTGLGRALSGRLSGFSTGGLGSSQEVPLWARRLGAPAHAIRAFDWTAADRYWNTSLKGFSRASDGWQQNASGVWVRSEPGILRRSDGVGALIEVARTNEIRNNTMAGAVDGSPGTPPTGWNIGNGAGLTRTITTGTTDGIPWIRFRFAGTTGNANGIQIDMGSTAWTIAANGEYWAMSSRLALVAGSYANITHVNMQLRTGTAAGALVQSYAGSNYVSSLTGTPQRLETTQTFNNASIERVVGRVNISGPSGVVVDHTTHIDMPQMEKVATALTLASSPIFTTSAAVTRAADAGALAAAGLANWTVVFDNGSTQTFNGVSGDLSIVPANLNRSTIKGGWAVAA